MARDTIKVVLTSEEALEVRTAMIARLHVDLVNGGDGALLRGILRKLGWSRDLAAPAPYEGEDINAEAADRVERG